MFKCLCDTIILDDFKTALDKLSARWLARNGMRTIGQHSLLISFMALISCIQSLNKFKCP